MYGLRSKYKLIHFVGIKGVAMTALAIIAKEMGIAVTGSDIEEEFPTSITLKRFNILPQKGFSPQNIPNNTELVVYTGAHGGSKNAEVFEAKLRGIPVLSHAQALSLFMEGKRAVSVAGSHGKTTTSAIIAYILTKAGLDPSFAVGCGEIMGLGTSGHAGNGEWFVAEADEYVNDPGVDNTPRFLWQKPEFIAVTNIDYDHPDVYADLSHVKQAFINFSQNLKPKGLIFLNYDDKATSEILNQINKKIIGYSRKTQSDFKITNITHAGQSTNFEMEYSGQREKFTLNIPGDHNVLNSCAAIAVLKKIGITSEVIRNNLKTFSGTKRRFEFIKESRGKLLYDDYAHHPTEIIATIKAAKDWFPKRRLIIIFQPHTYTRTKQLLDQFAQSFSLADEVIVTEIYSSYREAPDTSINGKIFWKKIQSYKKATFYAPTKGDVLEYLRINSKANDIIITMGAGDIYTWLIAIKEVL